MSSNSSSLQVSQPNLGSLAPEQHSLFPRAQIDKKRFGCHDSNCSTSGLKFQPTDCWSFLQQDTKNISRDILKIPTLSLTTKSLEMCTEMLGCETGCHVYPIPNKSLQTTHERQYSCNVKPRKAREIYKKTIYVNNFPPPLTSVSDGVRVQANRGGGRLVIMATSTTDRVYFKSERENGRLRLFFHMEYEYRESEHEFMAENGGKIGCNFMCGDGSGSKNFSLPVCVALS